MDSIAIVGIGCRVPGAADPTAFWSLLLQGVDAIGAIPADRQALLSAYHPNPALPGRMYCAEGGMLDGIDLFDAEFFGISPREASRMDPQHRLLLEVSWEALEDAGLVPERLAGTDTGVFIGVSNTEYATLQFDDPHSINAYTNVGGALSLTANRVSHVFDLQGPSVAVDTACSSSLVAVHLACQSLRSGEASVALAGGVNLLVKPGPFIGFSKASMLSPRGRCRAFDASADGYVRAEGAGVVVLKPLAQALEDGDPVYSVILGTGVNSDGRTTGISLPAEQAQARLLRDVYRRAGVSPRDVHYVEAHGTGTGVGDPIESRALGQVLGAGRGIDDACRVGSVKTNIGHLEPAAGIAGLIKVALALKHRRLPATLHFDTPNPGIPFAELGLRVQDEASDLPTQSPNNIMIMGVNSFGFGGTNAHVVVSDVAPREVPIGPAAAPNPQLLLLSARSAAALSALADAYADFFGADPPALTDVCYSAAVRRGHHDHRLAVVGPDARTMSDTLRAFAQGAASPGLVSGHHRGSSAASPLTFVFSGNGCQWSGMGRELLTTEVVFRETLESVDAELRPYTGWSLVEELQADEAHSRLHRTEVAQPALFGIQLGLCALLRSWGIEPQATVGHSVGEVAAAYTASALSFAQAVKVIYERSRAQALTAGHGKMAAAALSEADASTLIGRYGDRITLAAVNSPRAVTLSGDVEALEALGRELATKDVFFRILDLNYAFHSRFMDPIQRPLLDALDDLVPSRTAVRFMSAVTGHEDDEGGSLCASYWWDNIRRPVRFADAVGRLVDDGYTTFLEIGAHPILSGYLTECLREVDRAGAVVPTLRCRDDPSVNLLSSVGRLYAAGLPWDMGRLFADGGQCVQLPLYPWQRESYWNAPSVEAGARDHPLLGHRQPSAHPTWDQRFDRGLVPFLEDHHVQGAVVFPGAAYVEMGLAAARRTKGSGPCELEGLEIRKALVMPSAMTPAMSNNASPRVQTVLGDDASLGIYSRSGEATWTHHVVGRLGTPGDPAHVAPESLSTIRHRCAVTISKEAHYRMARARGLDYGPAFQVVEEVRVGSGEALGRMRRAPSAETPEDGSYLFHPTLLDGCFQIALETVPAERSGRGTRTTYVPVRIERVRLHRSPTDEIYCHAQVETHGARSVVVSCRVLDGGGLLLAEIDRVRFQAVDLASRVGPTRDLYTFRWKWAPRRPRCDADFHDGQLGQPRGSRLLPAPSALADRVAPRAAAVCAAFDRAVFYDDVRPRIDALCASYAAAALDALGCARDSRFTAASLVASAGVTPEYERFVGRMLEVLGEDGVLTAQDDRWGFNPAASVGEPDTLWRQLVRDHPAYHAELALLGRAAERIADVIRGRADPQRLLAPEQGLGMLEQFRHAGPAAGLYNRLLEQVVTEGVRAWPPGKVLRVLDIGSDTGGATAALLPLLPPGRTEYVVTCGAEDELARAEHWARDHPFVTCERLDLDDPGSDAGHPRFDLVIAANTVGRVASVRTALRRVRRVLASDGLLVLRETAPARMPDLILGLLPRWWRVEHGVRRATSGLLGVEGWRAALADAGYRDVAVVNDRGGTLDAQQSIILARGPHLAPAAGVRVAADTPPQRPRWLVFRRADPTNATPRALDAAVDAALRAAGHEVVTVTPGARFRRITADHFEVAPRHREDFVALCAALSSAGAEPDEILHLGSLTEDDWTSVEEHGCVTALHLVQGLATAAWQARPRLWLITAGAHAGPPGCDQPIRPSQAALWGVGRVLMNEHPELGCRLVDLRAQDAEAETVDSLMAELGSPKDADTDDDDDNAEDELLLWGEARYVHRLQPAAADAPAIGRRPISGGGGDAVSYRLDVRAPGSLENLRFHQVRRAAPGRGQVEIEVQAAGLNFRDVMWAMGLLTGEALENGFAGASLGMECAGRIVAVGDGVSVLHVGDEVMGFAPHAFSSFVITEAAAVVRKPKHLSVEEAAGVATAFITAHYALEHLARLRPGERVLIHGAAGGVGLAAVQIAQHRQAEIFGTAGCLEKRDFLRRLGVDHVLNSRGLDFADDITRLTDGEGIDVVLNSLAGEAIPKSLGLLRRFGRFLEIGKRDLYANTRLGLRPFRNNLSYFALDADQLLIAQPDLARDLLQEVVARLESNVYRPLPYRLFPFDRVMDAFRHMQQSKHIGKIVVSMRDAVVDVEPEQPAALQLDARASYLVTGGLSGFGLATAAWLVTKGARNLVLVGRRGMATPGARDRVAELEAQGATVLVAPVDLCDAGQVEAILRRTADELPPLKGIFHAAAVFDDGAVANMDRERFTRVTAPKARGAWFLHEQTLELPLDYFVMFSSGTTAIGNPGQANYVAANLVLESLAHHRRAQGLPALTVSWGAIAKVGYLARNPEVRDRLDAHLGLGSLTAAHAFEMLERLLLAEAVQVTVAQLDWTRWRLSAPASQSPKYELVCGGTSDERHLAADFRQTVLDVAPPERRAFVASRLAEHVGSVLGLPGASIDATRPIVELGLDSLMGVELESLLDSRLDVQIPVMQLAQGQTIEGLTTQVLAELGADGER